ncbi:hypothetical protein BY996DRAFT_3412413 [Phakopsora pachyrhizi]|nr:hypothetical protein BY996DRAFT_3412413 [Phakopsora pachyrhizi]
MREMVNGLISVGHLRSGKLNLMVNRPTVKSSTGLINRTGRGRLDDHGCEDHRLTESVRRLGQIRLSSVSDRSTAVTGLKRSSTSSSISQTTPVADRISLRSNGCFRSDFGLLMRPGNLRDRMRSKPLRRSSVLTSQRSFRQTSQRNDVS